MREGRLAERGTYRALVARGVDFHQFAQQATSDDDVAVADVAGGMAAGVAASPALGSGGGEDDSAGGLCWVFG